MRTVASLPPPVPTPAPSSRMACYMPRGLLPILLYGAFAAAVPTLYLYADPDYTKDEVKIASIVASGVAALILITANCCCCWYNIMLFFHTALEVWVIDQTVTFANAATTSDRDMALAIAAAIVIGVHLLPFFLIDNVMLLGLLAMAGMVVNTAVLVYIPGQTANLLLVFGSASALLAMTMVIGGVCQTRTSLLGMIRERKFLTCDKFSL